MQTVEPDAPLTSVQLLPLVASLLVSLSFVFVFVSVLFLFTFFWWPELNKAVCIASKRCFNSSNLAIKTLDLIKSFEFLKEILTQEKEDYMKYNNVSAPRLSNELYNVQVPKIDN